MTSLLGLGYHVFVRCSATKITLKLKALGSILKGGVSLQKVEVSERKGDKKSNNFLVTGAVTVLSNFQ